MKSYSYARSLLGAVGFVIWLGFIVGMIVAYWTAVRSGSPLSVAIGVMTGVSVVISTFLALALVQVGHAIIDIAENTGAMIAKGQMLPEQKREPQMRVPEAEAAGGLRAVRHKQ